MTLRRGIGVLVFLACAHFASAQTGPSGPTVQHVICDSGCAGSGGGGSVTQGTTPWVISFTATQPVYFATPQHVIVDSFGSSIAVTGTFWQATQPVSNAGTFAVQCTSGCSAGTPGQAVMAASSPVVIASDQSAVAITGTVTVTDGAGALNTIVDSGTLTAVTAITNALPSGSNVIGHVIADTGSTTAVTGNVTAVQPTGTNFHAVLDTTSTTAVTQATGTNLHTVVDSGTIGTITNPVTVTDGAGALNVIVDSGTLTAVTAITNALPAGSAILGKVGIDQTTPGTTNGVQVNAALPAGTNVIGHTINDTGSTTAVTGNVTVVQPTGTSLHAVLDTTSTTAATQATGTNLHTVTDATSVTTATLAAETTKVIGTVNIASGQAIQANSGTNLNTSLLALESGGNLATLVTNTTSIATAARQDTANAALVGIQAAIDTPGTQAPASIVVVGGIDPSGNTATLTAPAGVLQVNAVPYGRLALLQSCNALRRTNCR